MCTWFTSLPKILAFITTGAEELLPPEGNVISLPSEVRPSNLFFIYDSSCLIMSIGSSAGVSLVSCPWSLWKWQYLDMSRDRLLPNIRGGCSKLLADFSMARISLGLLDRLESSPWLGTRWMGGLWRYARLSFLSLNHEQNHRYAALRVDPKSVEYRQCICFACGWPLRKGARNYLGPLFRCKNQYGRAFLVHSEEDNPRSGEQKGLQNLWNLRRSLWGLGGDSPNREITNLGLEREIRSLPIDKARR
ncbi:hypothetical protein Tco_1075978 [Tanacetum coccineum]